LVDFNLHYLQWAGAHHSTGSHSNFPTGKISGLSMLYRRFVNWEGVTLRRLVEPTIYIFSSPIVIPSSLVRVRRRWHEIIHSRDVTKNRLDFMDSYAESLQVRVNAGSDSMPAGGCTADFTLLNTLPRIFVVSEHR